MLMVFPTVHWTLCAEKVLLANQIAHEVVPVPPYVNEGCGLGITLDDEMKVRALELLKAEKVEIEKIIEKDDVSCQKNTQL